MIAQDKQPSFRPAMPVVQVGWMRQFHYFVRLYDRIRDLEGDVIECGLGEGKTFAMLAYLVGSEGRGRPRTLWGFDSFEGLPEPTEWDASPRNPKKGEWTITEESIAAHLKSAGIDECFPDCVPRIVKGFLGTSLRRFDGGQVAFLHLDVDLYEGYRDGLELLYSRVVPGGVVAFDEYREFHPELPAYGDQEKWPGCTKAVDDFFRGRPERIQFDPQVNKYFVVKVG